MEYHVCHEGSGTTGRLIGPKQFVRHEPQRPTSATLSSAQQTVRGVSDL